MTPGSDYRIPAETARTELVVVNSRFVSTIGRASSVDEARLFLSRVRDDMPDANHHVYAYRIGFGSSVIDGMSDAGEPSGTAGPPVLAVLRGADIGDTVLVVSRFFGGTKLGTGGLVRAYSDAARQALASLKTELKIEKQRLGLELPYPLYEQVARLVHEHNGVLEDETFGADVMLMALFPLRDVPPFTTALADLSAGRVTPIVLD